MYLTPYFIWKRFFLGTLLLFLFFPLLRCYLTLIIAGHILVFVYGIKNIRLQFFGKVLYRAQTDTNLIALTFDDGPDPELTGEILTILKKYSINATFFVIGIKAENNPELLKRCFEEGHTIACHDLNHSIFSNFRTTKPLISDISKSQNIIKKIIGKKPLLYRPPVGLMNPHTLNALKYLNMQCIGWSKSVRDAGNRRLKKILKIKNLAEKGEVVLLHDILPIPGYKKQILEQINDLCISIEKNKIKTVTIDKLFAIKAYE